MTTSYIGPLTKNVIETFTKELKKPTTKESIMKNIVDPVVKEIMKRYAVYITCFMFMQLVIICLMIYIIIYK
jgi:hypothetical protein